MRNISFAQTKQQVYNRTKRVTRRMGWLTLKPGEVLCAIEKGQGLKKGEKITRICQIITENTRREPLNAITKEEVILEGFPEMSPAEFVKFYCKVHKGCKPETIITRIAFDYINSITQQKTLFE